MPNLRVVIEDMIAGEDGKVAVRYTLEGTHEGELFGVPPTGKRLSIKSISVERVSEGKIREHWRVTDSLDMMQQLGVVPEQGQEDVEPSH
jgi:predicted ester cyclase